MSRIFDALQRSGVEQTGIEYLDTVSVATKVFELPVPEQAPANSLTDFPNVVAALSSSAHIAVITDPESLAAEKFRFLGVRMRQLQQSRLIKRVLVTSSIAGEGKSLVSANLASVLARRKRQKVLLVEGDLRRPVLAAQFGLGNLAGLAEWLRTDEKSLSNIYHLEGPDFWLMPAGYPPANPLELLQSSRFSGLIAQLTELFDWIIIDSPPLLPLADTTVLARVTDGALLVVREGATERAPLQRSLESLKKLDLLGVVLNSSSNGSHHSYYHSYAEPAKDARKIKA